MAIADVYDALSTRRVYKEAFPHQTCVEIIKHGAGKSFDPGIVAVFVELQSEFRDIAQWHKDTSKTVNAEPPVPRKAWPPRRRAPLSDDDLSAVLEVVEQCTAELSTPLIHQTPFRRPNMSPKDTQQQRFRKSGLC